MNCTAKKRVFSALFALLILSAALLSGCGTSAEPQTEQAFLLDTLVSVTYYRNSDRDAVLDALSLCRDAELVFSRTDSRSELYRLNECGSMDVSNGLLTVLKTSLDYCAAGGGRFDVTMGGVSELYGFSSTSPRVPEQSELDAALSHVGYGNVRIDGHTVTLGDPEAVLDLGAAAKGYIADEMKALLAERGVKSAIISLGGNVLTLGKKPDGSDFTIGIQYPEKDSSRLAAAVRASDLSVVTSGVYERFFVENGKTWHHILDPQTGMPVRNGLSAVSIIGPESLECDALSTVCFVLGMEDGLALIESMDGYEAVFITEDHVLHPSSGFEAIQVS